MTKIHTLRELTEQAAVATADDPDGGLELDEIYRLLDVCGTQNEHIANPLNRDPDVYYFRPREKMLTGEEAINGRFLSLIYCGHDPYVLLCDHKDLQSLETSILSDSGIINPFITFLIAFVDFRVMPYRIMYRCRDGSVVQFNKQNQ